MINLIDGASVDSNDAIVGTVPQDVIDAFDGLKQALSDANSLKNTVETWSDAGVVDDPTINNVDVAISALISKVGQAVTDITDVLPDLDGDAASAGALALDVATNAKNAIDAAKSAVDNLDTLNANIDGFTADGTLETPLAAVAPAKAANTDAGTSANEAGQAAAKLNEISDILQSNAADAALTAANAARAADLAAAEAALTSVDGKVAAAESAASDAEDAYLLAKDTYLANATTQAGSAHDAATFTDDYAPNHVFTDLTVKTTIVQADTAAQKSLGADNSITAASLNVTTEVGKAKAAWDAAVLNAANAKTAYDDLNAAVVSARTAEAANQSVSQYRQTAETNAQTVLDENDDAAVNLSTAQTARDDAQSAMNQVVSQSETAVNNRVILDVSETVAAQTIITESALDTAIVELSELKDATTSITLESQTAANQVDLAATDLNDNYDPNTDPASDIAVLLANEKAAAEAALTNAQGFATSASSNLSDIQTALSQAQTALSTAQETITSAGANANSVAQAELLDAQTAVTELTALRDEAVQINSEAQSALTQAESSLAAIDNLIDQSFSAAQAQAQATSAFAAEANQAAVTAELTSVRAQNIKDDISKDNAGVYDEAITLASSLKTTMETWRTDNAGDTDYTDALADVLALIKRVDEAEADNDIVYQLKSASTNVDTAYDTIFTEIDDGTPGDGGALNLAQTAATAAAVTPISLVDAKANALIASNNAGVVETQTSILEAQRSVITRLLNDVKAVEDGFAQIKSEADAIAAFNDAQTAAQATPDANDDTFNNLDEDAGNVINVFTGAGADSRPDGGTVELVSVGGVEHGTLEIVDASLGTVRYTPSPDYNGPDSFTYTISNGVGVNGVVKYASATVTLSVDNTNDNPVAVNDFVTTSDEVSAVDIRVLLNDSDVDTGDTIELSGITSNGSTISVPGNLDIYKDGVHVGQATWIADSARIIFTPKEGAFDALAEGVTDTVSFSYEISDVDGATSTANITVTVTGTNDAPVVSAASLSSVEDVVGGYIFSEADFAGAFSDVDTGDSLQSIRITKLPYELLGVPPNVYEEPIGSLTLDGVEVTAHSDIALSDITNLVYTPKPDFFGDVLFQWKGSDGTSYSDASSITSITFSNVNDLPVVGSVILDDAQEDIGFTFTAAELLENTSDADGDSIGIYDNNALTSTPVGGTIVYNGDNTWTYTGAEDYTGPVEIGFQVYDGRSLTTGTASFVVTGLNDGPINTSPTYIIVDGEEYGTVYSTVAEDELITDVFSAEDPEGDVLSYALALGASSSPKYGDVVINQDGTYTYTPIADFDGYDENGIAVKDTFEVVISDPSGASMKQLVEISVVGVNDAPLNIVIDKNNLSEASDGAAVGALSTIDIDVGDSFTYSVDDARFEVSGAILKLKTGESLDFETEPTITLNVTSTDYDGLTVTKEFSINVNDINEAPTGINIDSLSVDENAVGGIVGNVSSVDQDAGELHTYGVYSDAGATTIDTTFEIVNGELKVKDAISLDYEAQNQYVVYVKSTDQAGTGLDHVKMFTIGVNDLNEPSEISSVALGSAFVEDATAQPIFGTLSVSDIEGDVPVSATIVITNATADDVLNFTDTADFAGSYVYDAVAGAGTLTISTLTPFIDFANTDGASYSSAMSIFASAIQSVTYETTSDNPDITTRIINLSVNDGNSDSLIVSENVTVTAVNDAPVLDGVDTMAALVGTLEDTVGPVGTLVSDLVSQVDGFDAEGAAMGIAVTFAQEGLGRWDYSLNGGSSWTTMAQVNPTMAQLLEPTDMVRFEPNYNYNGNQTLQFQLWDMTTGSNTVLQDVTMNGGTTAFGADTLNATVDVVAVNDAPSIPMYMPSQVTFTEDDPATLFLGIIPLEDIDSNNTNEPNY